jgi:hypothetical protein
LSINSTSNQFALEKDNPSSSNITVIHCSPDLPRLSINWTIKDLRKLVQSPQIRQIQGQRIVRSVFPRTPSDTVILAPALRRLLSRVYPANGVQLASRPKSRLSLISRHLERPAIELNTPFSKERAVYVDLIDLTIPGPELVRGFSTKASPKNNKMASTQANHPTLLVPGPIEFDDAVLQSMAHYRYVIMFINASPADTVTLFRHWYSRTLSDFPSVRAMSALHLSRYLAKFFRCSGSYSLLQILAPNRL